MIVTNRGEGNNRIARRLLRYNVQSAQVCCLNLEPKEQTSHHDRFMVELHGAQGDVPHFNEWPDNCKRTKRKQGRMRVVGREGWKRRGDGTGRMEQDGWDRTTGTALVAI